MAINAFQHAYATGFFAARAGHDTAMQVARNVEDLEGLGASVSSGGCSSSSEDVAKDMANNEVGALTGHGMQSRKNSPYLNYEVRMALFHLLPQMNQLKGLEGSSTCRGTLAMFGAG